MADSSSYTKPPFPFSEMNSFVQPKPKCQGKTKSLTNVVCKSVFVVLLLILIPLFPSQAPEFVNQTFLTKFWELIHLLVIGIAVSYGLFCRRKVDTPIEQTHSGFDISQSYVSRVFNVSSSLEDEFEDPCWSNEKRAIHSWNTLHVEGEDFVASPNGYGGVEEQYKPHMSMSENVFENQHGYDQNNGLQAWNSVYYQGEPMVVVAQPNYGFDEWGKPVSTIDHKSLGLPVRSLKSRPRKPDGSEFVSGSEAENSGSSKNSDGSRSGNFGDLGPMNMNLKEKSSAASPTPWSSSRSSVRSRSGSFGDVGPMNVEEKFGEAFAAASPTPWSSDRSRSGSFGDVGPMNVEEKLGEASAAASPRPYSSSRTSGRSRTGSFGDLDPMNLEEKLSEASAAASPLSCRSSRSSDRSRSGSFGDLESVNLEEKFSEASAPASPIPWRSRSVRMEMRDKERTDNRSSYFRPLSIDETQFESLKPRSWRSTGSLSSQSSSTSPSHSISPDLLNSGVEDLEEKKNFHGAVPKVSPSPPKPVNGKTSLTGHHSRHYSLGSISRRDACRSTEDESKEWSKVRREDPSGSEDSMKLNVNPAGLTKAPSRGRSVRTIRASGLTAAVMKNEEVSQSPVHGKSRKIRSYLKEEAYTRKDKTKVGLDGLIMDTSEQNLDNPPPVPLPTFLKYDNKGKEGSHENAALGAEEDSKSEAANFRASSDGHDVSGSVSDAGQDSDEVDKKAGEFIAKFREQIMLQKMASIDRSRGLRLGNCFR